MIFVLKTGTRTADAYNHAMAKSLYKVTFLNHGKVYELYARNVSSGQLWGFTEVADLLFDVHDGVVVDPTEERLRDEFGNTASCTCRCRASSASKKSRRKARPRSATPPPAKKS